MTEKGILWASDRKTYTAKAEATQRKTSEIVVTDENTGLRICIGEKRNQPQVPANNHRWARMQRACLLPVVTRVYALHNLLYSNII